MMNTEWFFIDTHERGLVRLARLPFRGRVRTYTRRVAPGRRRPGVNVPALCQSFFGTPTRASVRGVCVVAGPGSFSSVRAGVVVANVLARWVGCPLVGVTASDAQDVAALRDQLVLGRRKAVLYVAPVYDAPPNIT